MRVYFFLLLSVVLADKNQTETLISSFLQTTGFTDVMSASQAFMPPGMRAMAGPLVAMAQAEANRKIGVSNLMTTGEDYPWICPCAGFDGYQNYTATVPVGKCPYSEKMGCMDQLGLGPR